MRVFALIIIAFLCRSTDVVCQTAFRVSVPSSAFSVKWQGRRGTENSNPDGRCFWGNGAAVLVLEANLRVHPSVSADPRRLQRLVVHFRSKSYGAKMRVVRLQNGRNPIFQADSDIAGNFITTAAKVNSWVWKTPIQVSPQTVIHIEIQYPTGFEGPGTLEPFTLHDVEVDYPLKPIAGKPVLSTTRL